MRTCSWTDSGSVGLAIEAAQHGRRERGQKGIKGTGTGFALPREGIELYRALGDRYQLMCSLGSRAFVELLNNDNESAIEHLLETLQLAVTLGVHEVTVPLVMAAELLRRHGDQIGASHVHQLARRMWPHDNAWFNLTERFAIVDTDPLDALPHSRLPVPSTMRERVEWATERLKTHQ